MKDKHKKQLTFWAKPNLIDFIRQEANRTNSTFESVGSMIISTFSGLSLETRNSILAHATRKTMGRRVG